MEKVQLTNTEIIKIVGNAAIVNGRIVKLSVKNDQLLGPKRYVSLANR